jgi:hypothetical protein
LPHETGFDLVVTGQRFDLRLGPAGAFLDLGRDNQAGAAKGGEVGGVAIAVRDNEGDWRAAASCGRSA